jgi:transposase
LGKEPKCLENTEYFGILLYNIVMQNTETITESIAEKVKFLERKVEEQAALIKYYEEQMRLLKHKRFGSSSEKSSPGQMELPLFDEAENEAYRRKPEPTAEQITYTRRKREAKREDDLSGLPVETVVHSIPEKERKCPACGETMHIMGHSEPRREIEIIPAQVKVIEHIRETYSCRNCEHNGTSVPVIKAPISEPVIKGSAASPSTVAHVMVQKYVNAVPLYRQEADFAAGGFVLSRQTMANWMIYCSERWLEPLYGLMKSRMEEEEILHADETVLQVLREPGRASRTNSYMWLYMTGVFAAISIALYEYQETRSSSHPRRFLEKFRGYLHCDGYQGYHSLPASIKVVGCLAHARRKFDEAVKSAPPDGQAASQSQKGLDFCNELFAIERRYAREGLSPQERFEARLHHSKTVSDALFAWAGTANALPKSALGRALHYLFEQRPYLENVYRDGRLELSNNRAERGIKPFVIGRKNWMFSASPKGARASSVIYSIIETAKMNRLKPFEYLKYIFETMPNISPAKYGDLLPWSEFLPEHCKLDS